MQTMEFVEPFGGQPKIYRKKKRNMELRSRVRNMPGSNLEVITCYYFIQTTRFPSTRHRRAGSPLTNPKWLTFIDDYNDAIPSLSTTTAMLFLFLLFIVDCIAQRLTTPDLLTVSNFLPRPSATPPQVDMVSFITIPNTTTENSHSLSHLRSITAAYHPTSVYYLSQTPPQSSDVTQKTPKPIQKPTNSSLNVAKTPSVHHQDPPTALASLSSVHAMNSHSVTASEVVTLAYPYQIPTSN